MHVPTTWRWEGAVKAKLPSQRCLYETDKETEQTFGLVRSLRGHSCIAGIWLWTQLEDYLRVKTPTLKISCFIWLTIFLINSPVNCAEESFFVFIFLFFLTKLYSAPVIKKNKLIIIIVCVWSCHLIWLWNWVGVRSQVQPSRLFQGVSPTLVTYVPVLLKTRAGW